VRRWSSKLSFLSSVVNGSFQFSCIREHPSVPPVQSRLLREGRKLASSSYVSRVKNNAEGGGGLGDVGVVSLEPGEAGVTNNWILSMGTSTSMARNAIRWFIGGIAREGSS
jgi:hypothetical protein